MKNIKKALIVEQDALVAIDLKQELEKENFSVNKATSIVVPEIIIANDKTDVVIANTDVQTQPFFDKVKRLMKKYQIPLIWIGTLSNKEAMKKSEGMNVIGTFSKPFMSTDIVKRIVSFFNQKVKPLFQKKDVNNTTFK